MCGIVGAVINRQQRSKKSLGDRKDEDDQENSYEDLRDILFSSLSRLAYRGYDSSGIALLSEDSDTSPHETRSKIEGPGLQSYKISLEKSSGKLSRLKTKLSYLPADGHVGMGHTRWATHGPPTSINAHPHRLRGIALVHNGIIENYEELRSEVTAADITLISETDSEVALGYLHVLIKKHGDFEQALLALSDHLRGRYGLVIIKDTHPHRLYIIKNGSPLVLGLGDGAGFCASDAYALSGLTQEVIFLDDGDIGVLEPGGYRPLRGPLYDRLATSSAHSSAGSGAGGTQEPTASRYITAGVKIDFDDEDNAQAKSDHPHFMYAEILEQPNVLADLVSRCVDLQILSFSALMSRL